MRRLPFFCILLLVCASVAAQTGIPVPADPRVQDYLKLTNGTAIVNTLQPKFPLVGDLEASSILLWYAFTVDATEIVSDDDFSLSSGGTFPREALLAPQGFLHLRLVATETGAVYEGIIPYAVDNTIPTRPQFQGAVSQGNYSKSPVVSMITSPGLMAEYRLLVFDQTSMHIDSGGSGGKAGVQTQEAILLLDQGWQPYSQPIIPPNLPQKQLHIYIGYRLTSASGLVREESAALDFVVDTLPPRISSVTIGSTQLDPENQDPIFLNAGAELRIEAQDAVTFKVSDEQGRILAAQKDNPGVYLIAVDKNKQFSRPLTIVAMDLAGNASEPRVIRLEIDSIPPLPPPRPDIVRSLNHGTLIWPQRQGETFFYQILKDPDKEEPYVAASGPISWEIPASVQGLIIRSKARDAAGNETAGESIFLPYIKTAAKPALTVPEGESWYASGMTIRPSDSNGIIRYSLVKGSQSPGSVDVSSPVLDASGLKLDTAPDTEEQFRIKFRRFVDGSNPSDDFESTIWVDRKKPDLPVLNQGGFTNYINTPVSVNLKQVSDVDIFCSLKRSPVDLNTDFVPGKNDAWTSLFEGKQYGEPVRIGGSPDDIASVFELSAWAVDKAGNTSSPCKWYFVFEPGTIYVAPAAGNTALAQTGSRDKPFRSLEAAVQEAHKRNELHRIVMAGGNYPISVPLSLHKDLMIQGHSDVVVYPVKDLGNLPLIEVKNVTVSWEHVYISDSGRKLKTLMNIDQAHCILKDVQLAVTETPSAISARLGSLTVSDSLIAANDPLSCTLIDMVDSQGFFTNSQLESSNLPGTLAKHGQDGVYTLLRMVNSKTNLQGTRFRISRGRLATAMWAENSLVEAEALDMKETKGALFSTFITGIASASIKINHSSLDMMGASTNAVLATIDGAEFTLRDSQVHQNAKEMAYGFKTVKGQIDIQNCSIIMDGTANYMVMFFLEASKLNLSSSTITASRAVDQAIVTASSSYTVLEDNQIVFSSGGKSQAFQFFSGGKQVISHNIFKGDGQSVLFISDLDQSMDVRGNIMEGWFGILGLVSGGDKKDQTLINNIKELEALKGDTLFEGNRIRQGL